MTLQAEQSGKLSLLKTADCIAGGIHASGGLNKRSLSFSFFFLNQTVLSNFACSLELTY